MGWIEGIAVEERAYRAQVVLAGGERVLRPLGEVSEIASIRRGGRFSATLDFSRMVPGFFPEYPARVLSFSASLAHKNRHEVYETTLLGRRTLIPAVLIQRALIGRLGVGVADFALAGGHIDELFAYAVDDGVARVLLGPRGRQYVRPAQSNSALALWLCSFPSARAMWDSLHRHAISGALALDLPRACASVSFNAISVCGELFITRLDVNSISPTEAPHSFATEMSGTTIELFHDVATTRKRDVTLVPGAAGWDLTDEEWQLLKHLLPSPERAGKRDKVSLVLRKLGDGLRWQDVDPWGTLCQWFSEFERKGGWAHACERLMQHRTTGRISTSETAGRLESPEPRGEPVAILRGPVGWEVSDEEWTLVSTMLPTSRTAGGTRRKLGLALHKLGQGVRWRDVENGAVVASWYSDMRSSGRWDAVVRRLMEHRANDREPETTARGAV